MNQQKQRIIAIAVIGIVVVAVVSILPSVLTVLLSFLLAGSLPGVSLVVGPSTMFIGALLILAFVIGHLSLTLLTKHRVTTPPVTRRISTKLPSRRFNRI